MSTSVKLPGTTRWPQFNEDALAEALPGHGITYRRSEGLTGRRKVSKEVPFEINSFWRNRSFHNYADHSLGEEFATALEDLRAGAMKHTTASSPTTSSPRDTRSFTSWAPGRQWWPPSPKARTA